MSDTQPTKIVTYDEDEIQSRMLDFADSRSYWDEHERAFSGCDFVRDVLQKCSSLYVDSKTWDAGFPGRSGIEYTLTIMDEEALINEIKDRLAELAEPLPAPSATASKRVIYDNIEQIVFYLRREAGYIADLRMPGGYGGMPRMVAGCLHNAAQSLQDNPRDDEEIRDFLVGVAKDCGIGNTAKELRRIAATYRVPQKTEQNA